MQGALIDQLTRDYPQFTFMPAKTPRWNPHEHVIYYNDNASTTLHELGHALLGHQCYGQDIELIQCERAAWNEALKLAPKYSVQISPAEVETALDSYRDWLYRRSLCPHCSQSGVQSATDYSYRCPNCHIRWLASCGKNKALRRQVTPTE